MRRPSITYFIVLVISLWGTMLPVQLNAQQRANQDLAEHQSRESSSVLIAARQGSSEAFGTGKRPVRTTGGSGSIKEEISDKYRARYEEWKNEFLSTEIGRNQWTMFASNERFTLVITVSGEVRNGAGTSKYKWSDSGELVAATITLGSRIDEGYPDPIYYPVMSSLAYSEQSILNGNILAAAKIAHEFGHVKRAAVTDGSLYRLQNQLIPVYNKILLSNGLNTLDPRLIDLTKQMGGSPVQIWEDREYWGEANAMLYLRDRITKRSEQRVLFTRIVRTVELYAVGYIERFTPIAR